MAAMEFPALVRDQTAICLGLRGEAKEQIGFI